MKRKAIKDDESFSNEKEAKRKLGWGRDLKKIKKRGNISRRERGEIFSWKWMRKKRSKKAIRMKMWVKKFVWGEKWNLSSKREIL